MKLRAVGFDLWETLITNPAELGRHQERLRVGRIATILAESGYASTAADVERAHRSVWQRCQALYWSNDRDISCRVQVEHFLEDVGVQPSQIGVAVLDAIEDAYARAAEEALPAVVDGAIEVLDELRSRGLRVGLISNTGRTPGYSLRVILERLGLKELIDHMVFSNEHGECKPLPSIFERLRDGLAVPASEMVFVGDNLHVDVAGAKRSGMRAVHFEPAVRGAAVAPVVGEPEPVEPDARIVTLRELIEVLDGWSDAKS